MALRQCPHRSRWRLLLLSGRCLGAFGPRSTHRARPPLLDYSGVDQKAPKKAFQNRQNAHQTRGPRHRKHRQPPGCCTPAPPGQRPPWTTHEPRSRSCGPRTRTGYKCSLGGRCGRGSKKKDGGCAVYHYSQALPAWGAWPDTPRHLQTPPNAAPLRPKWVPLKRAVHTELWVFARRLSVTASRTPVWASVWRVSG